MSVVLFHCTYMLYWSSSAIVTYGDHLLQMRFSSTVDRGMSGYIGVNIANIFMNLFSELRFYRK